MSEPQLPGPRQPRSPERQGPPRRQPEYDYLPDVDYLDYFNRNDYFDYDDYFDYFRPELEVPRIRCVTPTLTPMPYIYIHIL